MIAGVALSVGTALLLNRWQTNAAQAEWESRFHQHAHDQIAAIHREVNAHLLATRALAAFYLASIEVTPSEFQRFSETLLNTIPSLQALEWIPQVPDSQRSAYEARQSGNAALPTQPHQPSRILERDHRGPLVAAATRPYYYPVDLVEPLLGNTNAIGFDLASEAVRKEALERARDACTIAVSGPITLVQQAPSSGQPQAAFLTFIPIYRRSDSPLPVADPIPGTVEQRRQQLLGFVLAVSHVGTLVEAALAPLSDSPISLQLTDITRPEAGQLLYRHGNNAPKAPATTTTNQSHPSARFELDIGGRRWLISASANSDNQPAATASDAWFTLLAGLLLTALLTLYVHALQRHTRQLTRLEQREALLSHCNHSLARSLTEQQLLDAFCRILVRVGPYQQAHIDYPATTNPADPITAASHQRSPKPRHPQPAQPPHRATSVRLPLQTGGQTLGTLSLQRADHHPIGLDEQHLLTDIAAGLAFGIDTRRTRVAQQQQVRRLREDVEHEQRRQLAATLHDGVGQSVQAIHLGLKRLHSEPDAAGNRQLLGTLIDDTRAIIHEFRHLSHELRPLSDGNRDLHAAIRQQCDTLRHYSNIPIECALTSTVADLPERTREQCFLAFREALSNAVRHSNASQINVTLLRHPQGLQLTVSDNGTGFDSRDKTNTRYQQPTGLGLSMIAERCHSVGAHADINSRPTSGTAVTLNIPIPTTDQSTHLPDQQPASQGHSRQNGHAVTPA